MLWLCAEWSRFEVAPGVALMRLPEGRTVTGAVWLSLGPTLAGGSKVDSRLQAVAGDRKVPIARSTAMPIPAAASSPSR